MTTITGIEGLSQGTYTGQSILTNGMTVFTITGGPVRITDLVSYVDVDADTAAATVQWSITPTVGTATTITGATTTVAGLIAGTIIYCNFTALATAPVITQTAGVALYGPTTTTGGGIYSGAGLVKLVIGGADTTLTMLSHYIRYIPLGDGISVTAAF